MLLLGARALLQSSGRMLIQHRNPEQATVAMLLSQEFDVYHFFYKEARIPGRIDFVYFANSTSFYRKETVILPSMPAGMEDAAFVRCPTLSLVQVEHKPQG